MTATATHNLCVKVGEYTTMDNQEKKRWQRIGLVFKHDDGGTSIKLECLPVGIPDWDGWVSVFPRDQQQEVQQQQPQQQQSRRQPAHQQQRQQSAPNRQQQYAPPGDFDDHIPF